MKKIAIVFSLLLAVMSCSKEENPAADLTLSVSPNQIEIGFEGGNKDISVTSNVNWVVSSSASDWCSVSSALGSNNGSFQVKIESNETLSPREAKITVKSETLEKTITIEQEAASKLDLLKGSSWEMISQGSSDDNYNDLVGTIIDLKDDMSTTATMNLEIEEGVFLEEISGTWSLKGEVISIEGDFLGMDAVLSFEIKEMTETMIDCVMNINLPLLPPDGIPVVFKKVAK